MEVSEAAMAELAKVGFNPILNPGVFKFGEA